MLTKKRHTLTGKTLVSYKTQVGGILSYYGGHSVRGTFCPGGILSVPRPTGPIGWLRLC